MSESEQDGSIGRSFGQWLRQQRKARHLTQEALAHQLDYSLSTIRKLEQGTLRPSRELMLHLAEMLGVPPATVESFLHAARLNGDTAPIPTSAHIPVAPGLPYPPTPLVGRADEVRQLVAQLADPEVRLLSVVGPGGVGKTRLVIAAAQHLAESTATRTQRIVFVSLEALTDPRLVLNTILHAFEQPEAGVRNVRDVLVALLHAEPTLVILDNIEHLQGAVRDLHDLLVACPQLQILITSRVVLNAYGEHNFPVAPLPVPPSQQTYDLTQVQHNPAVRLFIQRARAVQPSLTLDSRTIPAIVAICQRLDGLPLALELAAARSRVLPPPMLLARLDTPLDILTHGATTQDARQQTLRAMMEWSYTLLQARHQTLFARLGVFVEAANLSMIAAVCGDEEITTATFLDDMEALVASHLVQLVPEQAAEPQFVMLYVVREYAHERLAARGELERIQQRYVAYLRLTVDQAEGKLTGAEQVLWLDRLEQHHEHLRAALQWGCANDARGTALPMAGALGRFWWLRGHLSEGRRWLRLALERSVDGAPVARAKAYYWAGILAVIQGDYHQALAVLSESLVLYEQAQEQAGTALALNALGVVANRRGDHVQAQVRYEESLHIALQIGNQERIATGLNNLGYTLVLGGHVNEARTHLRESLHLSRALGDLQGQAFALSNLGLVTLAKGKPRQAQVLFRAGLVLFETLGDQRNSAEALEGLAEAVLMLGDHQTAAELLDRATAHRAAVGAPPAPHQQVRIERMQQEVQALQGHK